MATRTKRGISYGEISDFEGCVDTIRRASLEIAKESREYIRNSMLVSDGDIYTSNIKGYVTQIQNCMRKINAYSKRYGNM